MTEAAAVSSIPPATVAGGEFREDSLPVDPLLQSGTYIDAESNVSVGTTTPKKAVLPDEGNVPDLTPAPAESAQEIQTSASAAEKVTPPPYGSRSAEVNVERPSWLPMDWRFEAKVRTSGATAGTVDRYYYEPVSGSKFRSKTEVLYFLETGGKRKKANPGSGSDSTLLQRACAGFRQILLPTWTPYFNGGMIPGTRKQDWDAVFSSLSKLKRRNIQSGR